MRTTDLMVIGVSMALLAGCADFPGLKSEPVPAPAEAPRPPTREQVIDAFTRLNRALQQAYERILDDRGGRQVPAPRADAFDALDAGLRRLGMIVESRDPEAGTLTVAAPAPRPLDMNEWRIAAEADTPMMGAVLCPILGPYCRQVKFEPDDFVIVINATVLAAARGGAEISLTARMREIKESATGMPRREYPPPTGVRLALDKIWAQFDRELAARQARPR